MSLVNRKAISLFTSIISIALIITTAWYALSRLDKNTRTRTKDALQSVLLSTQETLHIWINQRKYESLELSRHDGLIQLTKDLIAKQDSPSSKDYQHSLRLTRNLMRPKLSRLGDRDFYVISKSMKNLATMQDSSIDKTNILYQKRKEYIDSAFKGKTLFIPTIRSHTSAINKVELANNNQPSIFIASPITDFDGSVIAVLTIEINPRRHFTRITQLGRLGESGETYAFDEQCVLVSESRFDDQLRRIGLVGINSKGIMSIRVADPGGNLLEGHPMPQSVENMPLTIMADSAIRGNSGFNITGYRDYRGVYVFGAWIWDDEIGIGLTTEIDETEAMQPFYETQLIIIIIALLAILPNVLLSTVNLPVARKFKTDIN